MFIFDYECKALSKCLFSHVNHINKKNVIFDEIKKKQRDCTSKKCTVNLIISVQTNFLLKSHIRFDIILQALLYFISIICIIFVYIIFMLIPSMLTSYLTLAGIAMATWLLRREPRCTFLTTEWLVQYGILLIASEYPGRLKDWAAQLNHFTGWW